MLTLYLTDQCSLCDQAMDLLLQLPCLAGVSLRTVDIATDDALFDQYAEKIPVLRQGTHELLWPFDATAVEHLLTKT